MPPRIVVAVGLVVLAAAMVALAQVTGGDGTKPHPLGTEVVVGVNDASGGRRTRLGLTVLAVRTGTQAELEENGLEVDPEDRTATPYYIDARFANEGPNEVDRGLDVGVEDGDGNLIHATVIFSFGDESFEPCPEDEGTLAPGESVETCSLVIVPHGVDPDRVYFLSDEGPDEEPEFVYWAVE